MSVNEATEGEKFMEDLQEDMRLMASFYPVTLTTLGSKLDVSEIQSPICYLACVYIGARGKEGNMRSLKKIAKRWPGSS